MSKDGFTLIDLLVVIGIIGLLAGIVVVAVTSVRRDAFDTRIKNNVRQLRLLAESAYDANGATYLDWTTASSIQSELTAVIEDLDEAYGNDSSQYTLIESEAKEFCVSAALHSINGQYYCIDHNGVFRTTTEQCPATPVACPL